VGLLAALAAGWLAACADSGYQYVKSPSEDAFFKVPDGWDLFEIRDAPPEDRAEPIDLDGPSPWTMVFDAAPEPSPAHAGEPAPSAPTGMAIVQDITGSLRDNVTLRHLRASALDGEADPKELALQGDPRIEMIHYEDIIMPSGLRGTHMVFNLKVDEDTWTTIDHTALLNGPTTKAYIFSVRCSAECYLAHRAEISRVVDSWTVGKDRR